MLDASTKLLTISALVATVVMADGHTSMTMENVPPNVWLGPLDLSLGPPTPLLAEQVCSSVFTLRCEVRQITPSLRSPDIEYHWFVRNMMEQPVSIAVVRPPPPPINPRGVSRVYGPTWNGTATAPLSAQSLYRVRIQDATGWSLAVDQPMYIWRYFRWLPLEPRQEYEIYHTLLPADNPVEAALFSVPFQIGDFRGEAFVGFADP